MIDLPYVLRRAWQIFWRHRTLWLFGCLVRLGTLGASVSLGSRRLWEGAALEAQQPARDLLLGILTSPYLPVPLVVLTLGASFGLLLLGAVGTAALADQLRAAEERGAVRWSAGWRAGRRHLWRTVLIRLCASLPPLAVTLIGALPLVAWRAWALMGPRQPSAPLTGALALPLALACLVPALFLAVLLAAPLHILLRLGVCGLVLESRSVRSSAAHAWATLKLHVGQVLLLWLVQMGASATVAIAAVPAVLLIMSLLWAAVVAELASALAALALSLAGGLLLDVLMLGTGGLLEAFTSTLWTLAYREFGGLGLTGIEAAEAA